MFEGLNETAVRFGAFLAVFGVLAVIEQRTPRRALATAKLRRWLTNLTMIALGAALVRAMAVLAVPVVGTAAAVYATKFDVGLLNAAGLPAWVEIVIAVVVLDFAIFVQHIAIHRVPAFWRWHQVHHADVDFDVTTAVRIHPGEIVLSALWKAICVLLLGASVSAVLIFEVMLNASSLFSHANIRLPAILDTVMRTLIVTPDMHRVHHSALRREHDSNFGFNLSVWDRLFGTYRAQPEKGHDGMTIGLSAYQSDEPTGLAWSLILPFRKLPRQVKNE